MTQGGAQQEEEARREDELRKFLVHHLEGGAEAWAGYNILAAAHRRAIEARVGARSTELVEALAEAGIVLEALNIAGGTGLTDEIAAAVEKVRAAIDTHLATVSQPKGGGLSPLAHLEEAEA